MTKEQYEALSPSDQLMFDEMSRWSSGINARLEVLTAAVKKLVELASGNKA